VLVKLVDFGIAKLRESATHTLTGTVLGTPAYMSCEQAGGMPSDELDARSDIYSLGVVVYEMLTGRVPFTAQTPVEYLRKHLMEQPPSFRAVMPDLSPDLEVEKVVMKALAKEREGRYSSVSEFSDALAEAAVPNAVRAAQQAAPVGAPAPAVPPAMQPYLQPGGASELTAEIPAPRPAPIDSGIKPLPKETYAARPAPATPVRFEPVRERQKKPNVIGWALVIAAVGIMAVGIWYVSKSSRERQIPQPIEEALGPTPPAQTGQGMGRETKKVPETPQPTGTEPQTQPVAQPQTPQAPVKETKKVPETPQPTGTEPQTQPVAQPAAGAVRVNSKDGLKYVWIPPGSFQMGCSPGDKECQDDEKPPHQVTITKGYWLGQTEVTVGAYKRFAGGTGKGMPSAPDFNPDWSHEQMPIVNVSWDDAQAYCTWAGGRLPTEAEWEYAARAGSTEARYGHIDEVAWYSSNTGQKTHEVGQKRANSFGLYDILGNVWEWVNDWYDEKYSQGSPSQDPAGATSGQYRVLRGGSWLNNPRLVRVSFRFRYNPGNRNYHYGFRCGGEVFAP